MTLTFKDAAVRRSKMLVSTNRNSDGTYNPQTYTNTLLHNGTAVTAGATYSITGKPAGFTGRITVNPATGEVTFGKPALDKVNADGPQTVTIHFSPRRYHVSAVLNGDLYVIGGLTWDQAAAGTTADNTLFTPRSAHTAEVIGDAIYLLGGSDGTNDFDDVWTSADRGVTWRQAATTPRYPARTAHSSAVLGGTLYVIAGSVSGIGADDDIWRSTNLGSTWVNVHAGPWGEV